MFIFKMRLVKNNYVVRKDIDLKPFNYYRIICIPPNTEGCGFSLLIDKELALLYNYKSKNSGWTTGCSNNKLTVDEIINIRNYIEWISSNYNSFDISNNDIEFANSLLNLCLYN